MSSFKILIITPKMNTGGAERVASRLSYHFDNKYNTNVLSLNSDKIDYEYSGNIIKLYLSNHKSKITRIYTTVKAIYLVAYYKKKYEIDLTISFIGKPNIANLITSKYGICIPSIRTYIRKPRNLIWRKIQKIYINKLYNRADKIIAVSQGVKDDMVDYFNIEEKKIQVIYPYVDLNDIKKQINEKIEEEYHLLFKKRVIITVGRLTYDKGQWHLIRAFNFIKRAQPDAQLVIVGRGDMESKLQKLAHLSPYEKDIHFFGYKKNPFKYIHASTVFAFPSLVEGFGNAVLEAMACGKPVVSSDCAVGPREIIVGTEYPSQTSKNIEYHNNGVLVPVCDGKLYENNEALSFEEELLAKAIIKLLKDNIKRNTLEKNSLERAKYFDKDNIVKEWENIVCEFNR